MSAARERLQGWLLRLEDHPLVRYAWDNPSAEADGRSILASPKVGTWLGLLNLLIVLGAALTLFALPSLDTGLASMLRDRGTGAVLIDVAFATIVLFLTATLPFRASGLLEGPRWRGYLDQLITTGVSPLRYFAGQWASTQPFLWVLLVSTLPFVMLFGLLGGGEVSRVLLGYALIYFYANLIVVVAAGLGALVHEVMAVILTLVLFVTACMASITPMPSAIGSLTPLRFLASSFANLEPSAGSPSSLYGPAQLFGVEIPLLLFGPGLWLLIWSIMILSCALGPLHAFVPCLNNFGALVFPGDKKRFRFHKFRPFLTRRSELAFLFDNRSPALGRWALPLRSLQILVALVLISGLFTAGLFSPFLLREMPHSSIIEAYISVFIGSLLLALFLMTTGRAQSLTSFKIATLEVPQVVFDVAVMLVFLAWLLGLHILAFSTGWELIASPRSFWQSMGPPDEIFRRCTSILGVTLTMVIGLFLLMKVLAARVLGRGWVALIGAVYLGVICVLPPLALALGRAFVRADLLAIRPLSLPCFALAQLSPLTYVVYLNEGIPPFMRQRGWLFVSGFWFWHSLWILYLSVVVFVSHRSVLEESRVFASDDPHQDAIDANHHACPGCESLLQTRLRHHPWTGLLLTRFLALVRCLDCGEVFHGPSGERQKRRAFYLGLAQLLALVFAFVVGTFVLSKVGS